MRKILQRRYLLLRNSGRKPSHASEKNARNFTNCFISLFIFLYHLFRISGVYIAFIPSFIILREYFYIFIFEIFKILVMCVFKKKIVFINAKVDEIEVRKILILVLCGKKIKRQIV